MMHFKVFQSLVIPVDENRIKNKTSQNQDLSSFHERIGLQPPVLKQPQLQRGQIPFGGAPAVLLVAALGALVQWFLD